MPLGGRVPPNRRGAPPARLAGANFPGRASNLERSARSRGLPRTRNLHSERALRETARRRLAGVHEHVPLHAVARERREAGQVLDRGSPGPRLRRPLQPRCSSRRGSWAGEPRRPSGAPPRPCGGCAGLLGRGVGKPLRRRNRDGWPGSSVLPSPTEVARQARRE